MYDYRIMEVDRVIDGDTVILRVDVGFHLSAVLRFRLLDVDTPERGTARWTEATIFTESWLAEKMPVGDVRVATTKGDSFGRWLAHVYTPDGSLNDALLASGFAAPYRR